VRCDGKDLASLNISNKAEATLGAKALDGALHDDTSFLVWTVLSISRIVSRRVYAQTRHEPAAGVSDACIIGGRETASLAPRAWARESCELPIHRFLDHLGQAIINR
jgi:hypothetical protein